MNSIRRAIATSTWRGRVLLSRSYSTIGLSRSGNNSERPSSPEPEPSPFPKVQLPEAFFWGAAMPNSVHLVGHLSFPVLSGPSSSGNLWAATVIHQHVRPNDTFPVHGQKNSLPLWMPVLFQNDWAWTAASQLKKNDKIYVIGQFVNLNANPPVPVCAHLCQGNVQLLVDCFALVGRSRMKEAETLKYSGDESWKHLLANPGEWNDNRVDKKDEEAPDFEHKHTSKALWLSTSPDWVKSLLPPPIKRDWQCSARPLASTV